MGSLLSKTDFENEEKVCCSKVKHKKIMYKDLINNMKMRKYKEKDIFK